MTVQVRHFRKSDEKHYTSLYLTTQINIFREEDRNYTIMVHADFKKKIKKEFEEEINAGKISYISYTDSMNRESKCYELTFEQSLQILMSESRIVRKQVIAVLKELKNKLESKTKIPSTFSEALQLAANQAKKIEIQETEIKELSPKGEFFDTVTSSNDTIDIGAVAKVINLGYGRNKLFRRLKELKIFMGNNRPYQQYIDRGYFRMVETSFKKGDGSVHIGLKTVVYQKGIDYIIKKLNQPKN